MSSHVHAGQKASLAACRGAITLMACVSSDPVANRHLPQIIMGNQNHLSKRLLTAAAADPLLKWSNLQIWCEKTAWVTIEDIEAMLTFLQCLSNYVS